MNDSSPSSHPAPATRPPRRRRWATAGAALACGLTVSGLLVLPVAGAATPDQRSDHPDVVQRALDELVADGALPGALASVRDRDGTVTDYTAGVGDLRTGEPVPVDGTVRIGSNTKTYTAVVVLQLVGEGRVRLDAPVETYLPGLVRGRGIDGRRITVRQLLQHTSGLADYDDAFAEDLLALQHRYYEPREVLDLALRVRPVARPGKAWSYSNTNYLLAGLLVQRVTGRPLQEEIARRILEPLGLERTTWPVAGDRSMPPGSPRGYFAAAPGEQLVDVTEFEPSFGWAAGQLVSTPRELTEFFTALLDGRLLSPELLSEMKRTVAAPQSAVRGDERSGLGLFTFTLSCGGTAWGHGGDFPGYETRNAVAEDGRAAAVAVTALPTDLETAERVERAVDTALCQ